MSVLATAPQNILRAIVLTLAILYCIYCTTTTTKKKKKNDNDNNRY